MPFYLPLVGEISHADSIRTIIKKKTINKKFTMWCSITVNFQMELM